MRHLWECEECGEYYDTEVEAEACEGRHAAITERERAMTLQQNSLLLYLESCATEHGGRVKRIHMNDDDIKTAKAWHDDGFIAFGRISERDVGGMKGTHWVRLSDEAWTLAHKERRAKCERIYGKRTWNKAGEQ